MIPEQLLGIILAYLIGSVPTGIIVTRAMGTTDPRSTGSGNIGATNVGRSAGKTAGIITLVGDCLKGLVPTLIAFQFYPSVKVVGLVGFAAFLGHVFPIYLRFKGGKGVATALGIFVVISPIATLLSIATFIILVLISRYVSLGSMISAASMPIFLSLFSASRSFAILGTMVAIIIILRHSDNIKRLFAGEENKVGKK